MLKLFGIIFVWTLAGALVSGLLLGIQRDIERWRRRDDAGEGKIGYWPVLLGLVVLGPAI